MSTRHPHIPQWIGSKPRVLLINRKDMVPEADRAAWSRFFAERGHSVQWTHGNQGDGVSKVRWAPATASQFCWDTLGCEAYAVVMVSWPHLTVWATAHQVPQVMEQAAAVGRKLNEKRLARGLRPRPVRAVVIGFPNVGQCALGCINELPLCDGGIGLGISSTR